MKLKKMLALTMAAVLAAGLTACGSSAAALLLRALRPLRMLPVPRTATAIPPP